MCIRELELELADAGFSAPDLGLSRADKLVKTPERGRQTVCPRFGRPEPLGEVGKLGSLALEVAAGVADVFGRRDALGSRACSIRSGPVLIDDRAVESDELIDELRDAGRAVGRVARRGVCADRQNSDRGWR
jgi:hypothetical protein